MYRMQQREMILSLLAATSRLRDVLLDSGRGASRDGVCRAHAHATGAADHDRPLPACGHRAARTRRRAAASRLCQHQPESARAPARSPGPAFRSIAAARATLLGFDGPTGNTYGSIATVDYLLESVSAAAVLLAGLGRVVQDLLLWCTARIRLSAPCRRVRSVQQHHAAEAQPGGARARARDRQQGPRTGERDPADASTTRPSATSSIPKTICSRSCSRCSTMPIAQ